MGDTLVVAAYWGMADMNELCSEFINLERSSSSLAGAGRHKMFEGSGKPELTEA